MTVMDIYVYMVPKMDYTLNKRLHIDSLSHVLGLFTCIYTVVPRISFGCIYTCLCLVIFGDLIAHVLSNFYLHQVRSNYQHIIYIH